MGSWGPGLPGGMAQPQEVGRHGSILIQATILSWIIATASCLVFLHSTMSPNSLFSQQPVCVVSVTSFLEAM